MSIQQDLAAVSGNPIDLTLPDVDVLFVKDTEVTVHGGSTNPVLFGPGYPKVKDSPNAVRLRFERVGIERGSVIFEVQRV
jgi:hypothetical protein